MTGSSGGTIDSRIFLGNSRFKGELVRGGVPADKIIIPAYGNQAYPLIRECETPIRAAVLYENNDSARITLFCTIFISLRIISVSRITKAYSCLIVMHILFSKHWL